MNLRALTLLGVLTSMVTGVTLGVILTRATTTQPSTEARSLDVVIDHVMANYVHDVPRAKLVDDALRGIVSGLDPHSKFLDGASFDALETDTTGSFIGVGLEIGLVDGYFTVLSPIPQSPAGSADILAGDRLIEVDAQPLKGLTLRDAITLLRGPEDSVVNLALVRAGERRDVRLARARIELPSVRHRRFEEIGYLDVSHFHRNTATDLKRSLEELGDVEGLVLDLRGNPGGLLGAAVDVVDTFVDAGVVVSIDGRGDGSQRTFEAEATTPYPDTPIVVLIDQRSASAAEVVAGALKDHDRATIMGQTSYGKGSVQSVLRLPGERGVKLTTAHYFTPSGTAIHGRGVTPDIAYKGSPGDLLDAAVNHLRQPM